MISDIRVFSLGRATPDVITKVAVFFRDREDQHEKVQKEYFAYCHENYSQVNIKKLLKFNLHDCKILSHYRIDEDMYVDIDNTGGFTSIKGLILRNCKIIKQDADLKGAVWIYDEIYPKGDSYEIHALLFDKDYFEVTMRVNDIEYVTSELR